MAVSSPERRPTTAAFNSVSGTEHVLNERHTKCGHCLTCILLAKIKTSHLWKFILALLGFQNVILVNGFLWFFVTCSFAVILCYSLLSFSFLILLSYSYSSFPSLHLLLRFSVPSFTFSSVFPFFLPYTLLPAISLPLLFLPSVSFSFPSGEICIQFWFLVLYPDKDRQGLEFICVCMTL